MKPGENRFLRPLDFPGLRGYIEITPILVGRDERNFVHPDAEQRIVWAGYVMLLIGVIPLAHAAYLTFNRFINRRLRLLYEAALDTPGVEPPQQQ